MSEPEHVNIIAEEAPAIVEQSKAEEAAVEAPRAASEIVVVVAPAGLTPTQQAAVAALVADMKQPATSILADTSALSVTVLLGKLVKAVEGMSISSAHLTGADKKAVVLEVGKQLIGEHAPAEQRSIMLSIYELAAEPTLEAMVDVSKTLNVGFAGTASAVPVVSPAAAGGLLSSCLRMCVKKAVQPEAATAPAVAAAPEAPAAVAAEAVPAAPAAAEAV